MKQKDKVAKDDKPEDSDDDEGTDEEDTGEATVCAKGAVCKVVKTDKTSVKKLMNK